MKSSINFRVAAATVLLAAPALAVQGQANAAVDTHKVVTVPLAGANPGLSAPRDVAYDATGNRFVVDLGNNVIRRLGVNGRFTTYSGSFVRGFADGDSLVARFQDPSALVVDSAGQLFVADGGSNRIRKIAPRTGNPEVGGAVSTYAGSGVVGFADGSAATARFSAPSGIALDRSGNIFVSDYGNHRIRKVTPGGLVSTLAGTGVAGATDGPGATATFRFPQKITIDASDNLYVADESNNRVRKITPAGIVTTVVGSDVAADVDGPLRSARLNRPYGITVDFAGTLFVSENFGNRIRRIGSSGVTTIAGDSVLGYRDGVGSVARFYSPLAIAAKGTELSVIDTGNNALRFVTPLP